MLTLQWPRLPARVGITIVIDRTVPSAARATDEAFKSRRRLKSLQTLSPAPDLFPKQYPLLTEWLTAEEAAEYLKIKHRTLLLWARQGKITGYTLSGTARHVWRFHQTDLDATLVVPSVRPEGMVQ
jgi:excisionase family DNA binding protein